MSTSDHCPISPDGHHQKVYGYRAPCHPWICRACGKIGDVTDMELLARPEVLLQQNQADYDQAVLNFTGTTNPAQVDVLEQMRTHVLEVLNQVLVLEPTVLRDLIEYRVPVSNSDLIHHSSVVVEVDDVTTAINPRLGLLGVINGLLGSDHRIMAVFDDDEQVSSFKPFGGEDAKRQTATTS